jgi:BlaI family penicillinase repressor
MSKPRRLTRLELQILELLWDRGNASIREIQEGFPEPRPAYTTIQTTVYRLEAKDAVRRVRKVSNAHIFEPVVARDVARLRLLDEVLRFFGGRAQPMMAQLVEAGKLTRDDLRELEAAIDKHEQRPIESERSRDHVRPRR